MTGKSITVGRVIAAPADAIFAVLADPARHADIDGSGMLRGTREPSRRLRLGDRFGMAMRLGIPYHMTNVVTEFEPNRRIAWRAFFYLGRLRVGGGQTWSYTLEPTTTDDGRPATRVLETYDWGTSSLPFLYEVTGFTRRMQRAMEQSLANLDALLTGSAAPRQASPAAPGAGR